jgi:hypothetical protein
MMMKEIKSQLTELNLPKLKASSRILKPDFKKPEIEELPFKQASLTVKIPLKIIKRKLITLDQPSLILILKSETFKIQLTLLRDNPTPLKSMLIEPELTYQLQELRMTDGLLTSEIYKTESMMKPQKLTMLT